MHGAINVSRFGRWCFVLLCRLSCPLVKLSVSLVDKNWIDETSRLLVCAVQDMLAGLDGGTPRIVFGQTALFLHEILVECHL